MVCSRVKSCFEINLLTEICDLQLEACAHPFFDVLREPNACLPNGRAFPPLWNFTPQGEYCITNVLGFRGFVLLLIMPNPSQSCPVHLLNCVIVSFLSMPRSKFFPLRRIKLWSGTDQIHRQYKWVFGCYFTKQGIILCQAVKWGTNTSYFWWNGRLVSFYVCRLIFTRVLVKKYVVESWHAWNRSCLAICFQLLAYRYTAGFFWCAFTVIDELLSFFFFRSGCYI